MPILTTAQIWPKLAAVLVFCLLLAACGTPSQRPDGGDAGTWNGRRIGVPPRANPALRQSIVARATREWDYFNRQTVVLKGSEESIPHVGTWEDDDTSSSERVAAYWRAAGKGGLNGMDCKQPWSAAFLSYVMQNAGVPQAQFRRDSAHWVYLASMIDEADFPGRWFVPRRIADYSPRPGDLVCASRGLSRPATIGGYTSARALEGANLHCDLVVGRGGQTLDVIGGNVRNSVSKTTLELDSQGRLQPVRRRPWFLIMENRL